MRLCFLISLLTRCLLLCEITISVSTLSKSTQCLVVAVVFELTLSWYSVVPIDSCVYRNLLLAEQWAVVLSVPCNAWMFFTRVRAVYHTSIVIRWLFFVLWAMTSVALGIPFTIKLNSTPIGNGLCYTNFIIHRTVTVITLFTVTLFDTAVMVAISLRMVSYSLSDSWRSKAFCLIFGNEMGHTSRVFLKSSQKYYWWVLLHARCYWGTNCQ